MAAGEPVSLFIEALHAINRTLEKHHDSPVCQQLVSAGERHLAGREFGVAVYDVDPSSPFDQFSIRLRGGSFEMVSRVTHAPDLAVRVPRVYLERIVDDPEAFIENPARLVGVDWDQLKRRLGVEP